MQPSPNFEPIDAIIANIAIIAIKTSGRVDATKPQRIPVKIRDASLAIWLQ
jgi:hypothetical protein